MSIQALPPDVVAQIKSSATISSLNWVVFELLKNSLDASSTKIEVTVDYGRGACIVEDNGLGIPPAEFRDDGGLGKLYHSSKLSSATPVHGKRGAFLASLSAMSLLCITSHHYLNKSQNTLTMHRSKIVSRQLPASPNQHLASYEHGTRVTVRDLFGNMPVRVKQRALLAGKQGAATKELEILKRDIVNLMLSWQTSLSLTVRDADDGQKMCIRPPSLDPSHTSKPMISKASNIFSQVGWITHKERSSWVSVSASTSQLDIQGVISLVPSATKQIQFISSGIQPLIIANGFGMFHEEINRLFQNSAFGSEEEAQEPDVIELSRRANDARYIRDNYTSRQLKGTRKGVDRWPMYYINIRQVQSSRSQVVDIGDILDEQGNAMRNIVELLQAMIIEFLTKHHFRPREIQQRPKAGMMLPARDKYLDCPDTSQSFKPLSGPSVDGIPSRRPQPVCINRKTFDHLGVDVKLPSFRRESSESQSPFEAWSRVKTGAAAAAAKSFTFEKVNASLLDYEMSHSRPSTAPIPAVSPAVTIPARSVTPTSGDSCTPKMPLLSSAGKIIRRPFEGVETQETPLKGSLASLTKDKKLSDPNVFMDKDVVTWVNPITRVESLVNQRTGHTIPSRNPSQSLKAPVAKLKLRVAPTSNHAPSPWLTSILKSWENPIFAVTEPPIPQVLLSSAEEQTLRGNHHHCAQGDIDRAFQESSSGLSDRISKAALRYAQVIGQIDQKFILAKVSSANSTSKILVLIDQHAADERVRIEKLLDDLCSPDCSISLEKNLCFNISSKEVNLFKLHKSHFARWGCLYEVHDPSNMTCLKVVALPRGIAERCCTYPNLLIDLLRREIHTSLRISTTASTATAFAPDSQDWVSRLQNCPRGILDMLNSRACRGAIMFNDVLSNDQCDTLIRQLGQCKFPFQCAHGRPSLIPLVETGSELDGFSNRFSDGITQDFGDGEFSSALTRWKESTQGFIHIT
ncbi:hypothetical protein B0O99DRAFT_694256 [Bisporella sp. PMI_857]|nr:hypothetical protein B0O99DRAFT_694256 [Bisporella sp. PMI_857]